MIPHGTIHWTELNTHNADKAMKFYGETLGWTFDAMPMGGDAPYYTCSSNGETVAGIFTLTGWKYRLVPEHWFTYFAVDDVDARVEMAKAAGGKIMRAPFDVPNVGRVAIVKSASGSASGWITPA
ncbi:MAG: VOC family protein [Oricola sp.]|nr:VOC family protein [Oricola sp.]